MYALVRNTYEIDKNGKEELKISRCIATCEDFDQSVGKAYYNISTDLLSMIKKDETYVHEAPNYVISTIIYPLKYYASAIYGQFKDTKIEILIYEVDKVK